MALTRRATRSDVRGLAIVRVPGWQVEWAGFVDIGVQAAMSIDENEVRWRIIDGQIGLLLTLVAVIDEDVVGFASIGRYRSAIGDDKALETIVWGGAGTIGDL